LFCGIAAAVLAWVLRERDHTENELVLYGNVDIRQVELAFFGKERIAELNVEEGDTVGKGQLLGALDMVRFRYQVELAEAQFESQQDVVDRLVAGTRPEDIRKARADLVAAEAVAVDAKRTYERMEAAVDKGAVAHRDLDDAKSAYDASVARVAAAQAKLDLAIAGPRKEDIAAAKANLEARRAELGIARRNLADASLYAPNDGVIQNRLLEVGDMASPEKPVFTIALKTPLWIRVYVDEPDLGKIAPGMKATVRTDSFPDKVYHGWVGFISPTAEFTPKPVETEELRPHLVYQARIYVNDPDNELRLGMPATVTVPLDQPKEAAEAPSDASEENAQKQVTTDEGE
jgi:HlyD family secretion protein